MSFFTNSSSDKFDIVEMWINNIGKAWDAMTLPIRLVITVVKLFMSTMKTVYNNVRTIINNIRNLWQRLPGLIRSAISSLVSIITQPFRDAYNRITGIIGNIKSAAQGITNINLSSITNKIVQPFVNAYNRVASEVDKIKQKASQIASNPLGALGFGFDIEGMLEAQAKGETNVTKDINLNVDLANVPAGVSTETLIAVLTDPAVLQALVGNNDFQSLDAKAKNRLALKNGRARGV